MRFSFQKKCIGCNLQETVLSRGTSQNEDKSFRDCLKGASRENNFLEIAPVRMLLEEVDKSPNQQNGIVERKHRHLLNIARALMLRANLPKIFWGDAILTTTYIVNRLPSTVLNQKTSWEMLFKQPAHVDHLKVFGCVLCKHNFYST